ncbi:MAG: hypothetical protein CMC82_09385 [Flavobacteriaceae bacterium]|nr:hypothetical protein [Flavobacteriaceae bacterium]|tara:strand:- start:63 stop:392 length:330 start_codon:yes stop_codon:yes gene_type:complete
MAVAWKIVNTDYTVTGTKGTNQIHQLHWTCGDAEKVGDVTHTGHMYGSVGCPDPSGSFIEYAKVTEANCITWAKALLGSDEVTRIEASVASQITESKTPKSGSGQPWSS